MNTITVDIADIQVTDDPESMLVTYALGSCIAVMVYDPVRRTGGMIHYMLPNSQTNPEKGLDKPGMFADLGVPLLFKKMYSLGSRKEDLIVKVAGGGKLYDDKGMFEIGQRNYMVLRKILWKNSVMISAEDVGGNLSRTARLFMADGRVIIRANGEERDL
ncbi:MAG TPA: chemotaxis protein CheD [bacterium]|nr:chemotaxis protein CheD [bacterium]